MKKTIILSLCCLFVLSSAAQDKQLLVIHTNDTHSCIHPLSPNLKDKTLAGLGGYLRRINMINAERQQNPDLLLFDSGDFSQGSAFYTLYKGDVEVELMNQMGYDCATIGNHEFDFGLENMARIFRKAKFPIVCSNYDFTGTPVEGTVKKHIILKRKGMKIGVFALDPEMKGLVDENKCKGVKYLDPIAVAKEEADYLKNKKKCDLVICISHMGWEEMGIDDKKIMAATKDIDLFLGGHSHTYMEQLQYSPNAEGKLVGNDQNGKHGIWVGRLVLNMKKK